MIENLHRHAHGIFSYSQNNLIPEDMLCMKGNLKGKVIDA